MIKNKNNRCRKVKTNNIVWTICTIFFLSFSNNSYAQVCLDTNKIIKTQEDWDNTLDSLFYTGIMEPTTTAWAVLRIKVDENGKVVSAHIVKSTNIDTSKFYNICATIEDCYYTPFLRNEYMMYQDYIVNGYLYANYMIRFPK